MKVEGYMQGSKKKTYQFKMGLTRINATGIQLLIGKRMVLNLEGLIAKSKRNCVYLDGAKVSCSPQLGSPFRVPRIKAGAISEPLFCFIPSTCSFSPWLMPHS